MRHLRSVLYAIVGAPTVWTLCAVGLARDAVGGPAILVLAGAAYALLLLPRFSPAGPVLAGLAFLAMAGWAFAAPESFGDAWPDAVTRSGFDLRLPAEAMAAVLGPPLLATAFLPHRWRRRAAARPARSPATAPGMIPGFTERPPDSTVLLSASAAEATQVLAGDATQVITPLAAADQTQRIAVREPPGDLTVRIIPPPVVSGAPAAEPDRTAEDTTALAGSGEVTTTLSKADQETADQDTTVLGQRPADDDPTRPL